LKLDLVEKHFTCSHGVGKGGLGWILKSSAQKVVFLVLSGKKQISPLLAPLEKFRKNS